MSDTDLGAENVASHPGAMLSACYFFAELALVGSRNLMPHELVLSVGMLAFAQAREMFRFHGPGKLPLVCKLALPFAVALLFSAPIVLFPHANSRS